MILIIGGQGAGKRRHVLELGYGEDDIAAAVLDSRPVLADLHLLLMEDAGIADCRFEELLRKEVIVCNEVGCGVVPMDAAERAWRDLVGRTCARLAARADRVVRLCCGIPVCIKGGDPSGDRGRT